MNRSFYLHRLHGCYLLRYLYRTKQGGSQQKNRVWDVVRDGVEYPGFTPLQAADILAYEQFLATKRNEATRWGFLEFDKSPVSVLYKYTVSNLQTLDQWLRDIGNN